MNLYGSLAVAPGSGNVEGAVTQRVGFTEEQVAEKEFQILGGCGNLFRVVVVVGTY